MSVIVRFPPNYLYITWNTIYRTDRTTRKVCGLSRCHTVIGNVMEESFVLVLPQHVFYRLKRYYFVSAAFNGVERPQNTLSLSPVSVK